MSEVLRKKVDKGNPNLKKCAIFARNEKHVKFIL